MSVPSMVHRSGDTLVVRSVVSGDALYGTDADLKDSADDNSDIRKPWSFGGCGGGAGNDDDLLPDAKDLPECKVKRNYSCTICDFFTQNPRSFLYHLRDVHKEKVKIYECPKCLYASKHFQKLLRHKKMVHGGAVTAVASDESQTRGGGTRSTAAARKRSLDEMADSGDEYADVKDVDEDDGGGRPVHKCSMCAHVAKTLAALSKHERDEHIKTKFFRCTKCTYVTHMKARFTKHVKYHSMPMIKCDMCDFRTPYKWNLDRHCKNHNGRGAFRCSACNFTADIKQSLTVHEMNHHVPPVGQAAGLGVGRRRNKVGASDSTAAEDGIQVPAAIVEPQQDYVELTTVSRSGSNSATQKTGGSGGGSAVAAKVAGATGKSGGGGSSGTKPEADFVHPDDIVQHANGKVYVKSKCRFCTFKTAWDSEMLRHEQSAHGELMLTPPKKKVKRPVPGLLPIALSPKQEKQQRSEAAVMSQTEIDSILASSRNSDLKDFAKIFGGDDDLFACGRSPEQKSLSFFDTFKEALYDAESLTCEHCGYESKCLTEHTGHRKSCGKASLPTHSITSMHKLTSTRCQHCRQRCKSSKDLFNHLQTCEEALKANVKEEIDDVDGDCYGENNNDKKPHPMENRVFIWNKTHADEDNGNDNDLYDTFADNRSQDQDQMSIDLSIRAQSPASESSSSLTNNNYEKPVNYEKYYQPSALPVVTVPTIATPPTTATIPSTTDKIPTHGNDISVAQHKRVFKCPHCTFWASTASRFHVHIVGHLNKKPFECSLCAYRSNWRWDITKHIKLKSVRDPAHESAKVLMTDETGRRNYTKYNKYLTEIPLKGGQEETSGGMGTRPKDKKGGGVSATSLRPPPQLKPAMEYLNKVTPVTDKKKGSPSTGGGDGKKTYWQCKKCNFRDLCKDKCLHHVRSHVEGWSSPEEKMIPSTDALELLGGEGAGVGASRSGCWKGSPELDSERHCRLKHAGDVKVLMGGFALSSDTTFEQMDVVQDGSKKCAHCPFSTDDGGEYAMHLEGHIHRPNATIKCPYCNYYVTHMEELTDHLKLHGTMKSNAASKDDRYDAEQSSKRYKCATCPYVTNSKSQFTYHKQFHQPKNGQYSCTECSYNVSKRHLLHQHMKVHGITISPQKQNGEVMDLEEISDEIEEVPAASFEWQNLQEIPLVWVSKGGKFSKMYRCRYCPHVNLRKVNIMEHEKMHGSRDRNSRCSDNEHRCPECNYVCNNAGVLSSHNKVHQGLYGAVHGLVDSNKTDEEQIRELGAEPSSTSGAIINLDDDTDFEAIEREMLYFCDKCPARFLKKKEHEIHVNFHGAGFPNRCENCTYSSQQKTYLVSHSKVHTRDYQERTKTLVETNHISQEYPRPLIVQSDNAWIVEDSSSEDEPENNGYAYRRMNVPLSGTDLFLQKSEAEANDGGFASSSMTRIGKVKEKRYKCDKCPSAFEKREQFKLHMGLHGSNQQYACAYCDYAVSNQANLQQHEKKHKTPKYHDDDIEEVDASSSPPARDAGNQDKKYWCSMCPYTSSRRDAVDNHQKRHVKLSGLESAYTCQNCDYSVPQMHVMRDHMKLHFLDNRMHSPYGYMAHDSTEYMIKVEGADDHHVRYGDDDGDEDVDASPLNNNEGEKIYVNTQTGELGESTKDVEMDTS